MKTDNTPLVKRKRVEAMSNPDMDTVDRLSELPDDMIFEIFSSLATETTIATSVLSKRWVGLWREMRSLKFDNKLHRHNFSDNIVSALLSYQHSTIENLTIGVKDKCDPMDLTIWFAIAFAKHVSKLVLRLDDFSQSIMFPDGALTRHNVLKILKLMGPMYLHLPLPTATLNCLRELHLHHVRFQNGKFLPHLLKGCHVLEILVLVVRISSGILNITVSSPSLLKLTLAVYNSMDENFVLRTPRLEYLDIQHFEGVDSFIMNNTPKLTVAKINRHDEVMLDNVLDAIPSVEHLTISAPLMYPTEKTYYGLRTIKVETNDKEWCNLLTFMLLRSPNLEKLIITGGWYSFWGEKWIPPQYVPLTVASWLHTLEWKGYIFNQSDDREVAIFILKNARQLRNATFTVYKSSNAIRLQKMNEELNCLSNVVRASPLCHLAFGDFTPFEHNSSNVDDPDILDFSY